MSLASCWFRLSPRGHQMHLFRHISTIFLSLGARAGFIGPGSPCFAMNNHLDPASFKFISECSDQAFCSASVNGTCKPRMCRRDEYPFGFDADQPLPPLCPTGTFCPDEGSGCESLLPAGAPCQLNRDEQCAAPHDWLELASSHNFNGSTCLHLVCMHANVTVGQACLRETTTYTDIDPSGERHNHTITRDNCSPGHFCNESQMICDQTKPIGSSCTYDVECSTHHCDIASTCAESLNAILRVSGWQCVVTAVIVSLAIILTCTLLTLFHKRHRRQREKELRAYYVDQRSLRRAIIALHTAAAGTYAEKDQHRYDADDTCQVNG